MRFPEQPAGRRSCRTCGACCFSESERHVLVDGEDYERLGDVAESLVTWLGNRAFMKLSPVNGATFPRHCIALRLDRGSGTFSCAIYEQRPRVCRELAEDGPACHGELLSKAERPKRYLASKIT